MLNHRQTISLEIRPEGNINSEHIHTPHTQLIDMSADERRRTIWMIIGMFHKGKIIAAHKPIIFTECLLFMSKQKI